MLLTIRFYRQHDYDLIYLYKNPNFSMTNAVRDALSACAKGKSIRIKNPLPCNVTTKGQTIWAIHIEIKDAESINLIKNIKSGFRNSFIKNLIRYSMAVPNVYIFSDNEIEIKEVDTNEVIEDNPKTQKINKENAPKEKAVLEPQIPEKEIEEKHNLQEIHKSEIVENKEETTIKETTIKETPVIPESNDEEDEPLVDDFDLFESITNLQKNI